MADEFTAAYITTMLWAETDGDGESLDENFDGCPGEFGEGVMARIEADCAKFQADNETDLACDGVVCGPDFGPDGRAGHDFWLTRNGHGAGFWDGDWPELQGARLTAAAKAFGHVDIYIGDDGRLWLSP